MCDRREAFVGSQSLRKAELDSRREVGVIVRDSKVVSGVANTFEADWGRRTTAETIQDTPQVLKKKLKDDGRKAVAARIPWSRKRCRKWSRREGNADLNKTEVKETVEKAVKEAVRERVQEMLNESAEE